MKSNYCRLDNSIVSMLNFLILIIYFGYVKNALVLRKYTLMYLGVKGHDAYNSPSHSSREKKCVSMSVGRKNE